MRKVANNQKKAEPDPQSRMNNKTHFALCFILIFKMTYYSLNIYYVRNMIFFHLNSCKQIWAAGRAVHLWSTMGGT